MTKRFAIFASGSGSNAEALMEHAATSLQCEVVWLMSDQPKARALDRAAKFSVPTYIFPVETDKKQQELKILELAQQTKVDYILLAGYMRILSKDFVDQLKGRIINIHPSYLPDFPGRDGYGDAFKAGVKKSGITIHFVDHGVDSGPIIVQERFERKEDDTLESFKQRGLALEHKLYPQVMEQLALEKIAL